MTYKGWFKVDGVQEGDRTVEEQLQGLAFNPGGAHVLDLGCGEGLIAREMIDRGAVSADCIGQREDELQAGSMLCAHYPICFHRADLRDVQALNALHLREQYDVVLMLSIVHKMLEPHELIRWACNRASDIVAVRVPGKVYRDRSNGHSKHDIVTQMTLQGFRLTDEPATCRGEYLALFAREAGL